MSFIYTNTNPTRKLDNDSVVRAISIITDSTWEEAYMNLCLKGLSLCDMPSSSAVWMQYMKEMGYKRKVIKSNEPYTIEDFAGEHFRGSYLVFTGNHLTAVIDGSICDAYDCRNEIAILYLYKEVGNE